VSVLLDFRHVVRSFAATRPNLFFRFWALKKKNRGLIVRPDTQFVIEGYPRSANTFAVLAFQRAESRPVRLAHHLHVPAQIMRAVEWRIPTLVLIRKPVDAVTSLLIRYTDLDPRRCLRDYTIFYDSILSLRGGFVVGEFDEVVNNFGSVIAKVNVRFGTNFATFSHTETNVSDVFSDVDAVHQEAGESSEQIARPTDSKNRLKARIKQAFESAEIAPYLKAAQCSHLRFTSG
jgi:hypothetical protein